MERFKGITIILLLAFAVLASAAQTKPASVLLQEGLYAEEIEGDLDGAIKIYKQVIAGAKEAQRTAAQATYRIGMCYLKKGEKAKAAIQFSNLASRFPEQKLIVDKARNQLLKLRPPIKVFEPQALDEQIKAGKVPSFEVQLPDNTGLDLDSGQIALLKDEWPDRFDVAWDNDEGGVLMKKAGSNVRFLALPSGEKQRWDEAIYMARSDIDELRNSNTRGIWASRGKFAAVLTSEGNLAVIQIGDYDADKGTIYGWVEKIPAFGFGPMIERVVHQPESDKDCMIDFESGKLFKVPQELKGLSQQHPRMVTWLEENGIDAVGAMNGVLPGLEGVLELVVQPMYGLGWNASPRELVAEMGPRQCRHRARIFGVGGLPFTYFFKTGGGAMGILQILEGQAGEVPRQVTIRYKMLQEAEKTARTEVLGPVIERVIYSEATGKPFFFDLDTGQAFYPPAGLTRYSPEREVIEWSATKGIDFVNDRGRFELAEMTAVKVVSGLWESARPAEIRDALMKGSTQKIIPTHSKDYTISSPITYAFKTRENGLGLLQILEKEDENIRIRYKMLQQKPDLTAHKIFIPDADTKGVGVVLDLASGELLPAGQGQEQLTIFRKLGKGDLAYDGVLICLRGAKANLVVSDKRGDRLVELKTAGQIEDMTAYKLELRTIPGRLLVTTAEGDAYNVTLLAADARGIKLEYSKATGHDLMEQRSRLESARKLKQLGVAVVCYADDNKSKLPDTLQELEPYVGKKEDFHWILDNVQYIGKGKRGVGSLRFVTVIAYDKTLLEEGNGTNVLFGDAHVEFDVPPRLEELGITPKTPGARFDSKRR